jgi:hypothetical protein
MWNYVEHASFSSGPIGPNIIVIKTCRVVSQFGQCHQQAALAGLMVYRTVRRSKDSGLAPHPSHGLFGRHAWGFNAG